MITQKKLKTAGKAAASIGKQVEQMCITLIAGLKIVNYNHVLYVFT